MLTRAARLALALGLGAACGSPPPTSEPPPADRRELAAPEPTAPTSGARSTVRRASVARPTVARPTAARPTVPRCGGNPEPPTVEFTDFGDARVDATVRWVEVRHDERAGWVPAEPLDMPMHHASRIAWANLGDFAPLRDARDERLRFTFVVTGRDIRHRPGENLWLTEVDAHVASVCSVSAPPARAEGALLASIPTDQSGCDALERAVASAAIASGRCTADVECVIADVPACELPEVGCYWVAVDRDRGAGAVVAAIERLRAADCPTVLCDCEAPPTSARCVDGRCRSATSPRADPEPILSRP